MATNVSTEPPDEGNFPNFRDVLSSLQEPPLDDSASETEDEESFEQSPPPSPRPDRGSRSTVEDVWIAIMGVTGAGKSSFIQLCTGSKGPDIRGHGLVGFTQVVQEYTFMYKDRHNTPIRVHLIDTPGFDDTNRGDADVLKDIATWLSATYKKNTLLSGVLYLHRIIDPRMAGSAKRNLLMFMQLCGSECFQNVILTTTMWSQVPQDIGEARERELVETFWGHMKSKGSMVARHKGNKKSALSILDQIIGKRKKITLQIQQEIVENGKDLDQTAAGQQLDQDIRKERKKHEREMKELRRNMDDAIRQNDAVAKAHITEVQKELQTKIEEGDKARESIRANYEKLQKEREEELEKIKDKINEQVRQLEQRTAERDTLQQKLIEGQGNPAQIEKYLQVYEKKIEDLEKKMEARKATAERRTGGVSAEFGKAIIGAMLPWPVGIVWQAAMTLNDKKNKP